jgi:CSLREA domain-containing protein
MHALHRTRCVLIAAALALALCGWFASSRPVSAGIIIQVTTNADNLNPDGLCSLREAIQASNANAIVDACGSGAWSGADSIRFNIGTATPTISVGNSALPMITEQVTIAGNTGGATRVMLFGPGQVANTIGLNIGPSAANSTIHHLVISNFKTGIYAQGAGSVITSNFIGTDSGGTGFVAGRITGAGGFGNHTGVDAFGDNVRVGGQTGSTLGGACTGDCNVISGNVYGVLQTGGSSVVIQGNFIGTNALGNAAGIGNTYGVASAAALIGGPNTPARNVISGNQYGVVMNSGSVWSNYIGTNSAGTAAVPNSLGGIQVQGGNGAITNNLISGNGTAGIDFSSGYSATVSGNKIGTAADGVTPLPNINLGNGTGHGIWIHGFATGNQIGSQFTGIGNTVAFNQGDGVRVEGVGSTGNSIRYNSIHDNLGLGINNVSAGNTELAPPAINAVTAFSVSGAACIGCEFIDVYSDGGNEGRVYEGTASVASQAWQLNGVALDGPNVTATAHKQGNTSEFSSAFTCPDLDGDGICDGADNDEDGDGYDDETEVKFFGTDPRAVCTVNQWPSNLTDAGSSLNKLDIADLVTFLAPVRLLDSSPGPGSVYNSRWDLVPGPGTFAKYINILDITSLFGGAPGSPAYPQMFGNTRAFGKTCPFAP